MGEKSRILDANDDNVTRVLIVIAGHVIQLVSRIRVTMRDQYCIIFFTLNSHILTCLTTLTLKGQQTYLNGVRPSTTGALTLVRTGSKWKNENPRTTPRTELCVVVCVSEVIDFVELTPLKTRAPWIEWFKNKSRREVGGFEEEGGQIAHFDRHFHSR